MFRVMATITEMRFVGSNSHVYYDNLRNSLSADLQSKLLFKQGLPWSKKEALPWSLMKPQYITFFYLA